MSYYGNRPDSVVSWSLWMGIVMPPVSALAGGKVHEQGLVLERGCCDGACPARFPRSVSVASAALCLHSEGDGIAPRAAILMTGLLLLLSQYPAHQFLRFGFADLWVGWHRNCAPGP